MEPHFDHCCDFVVARILGTQINEVVSNLEILVILILGPIPFWLDARRREDFAGKPLFYITFLFPNDIKYSSPRPRMSC